MKIYRQISKYNSSPRSNGIGYIVVHWVGAVSSAKDNATYFYGGDRGASAHFFVDDKSVWQSVECSKAAWHCGGGLQSIMGHAYYGKCKNDNSIGIEMCCKKKDGKLYITDGTIDRTVELVKFLMNEYKIDSAHVIRHFDVTGKYCPGTMVDGTAWNDFKSRLKTAKKKKVGYSGAFPTGTVNKAVGTKANIKRWQSFLKWYGEYSGPIDGSFGNQTYNATKRFQTQMKLSCDGSCGPSTINAARECRKTID